MTADDARRLRRENDQLNARVNQLQGEVWDLSGRLARTMQALERSKAAPPHPSKTNDNRNF